MSNTGEKYLKPKELSSALCDTFSVCLSVDYIRDIRAESKRRGDGTFVAGCARPTELLQWLRVNSDFTRRRARENAKRSSAAGFSV